MAQGTCSLPECDTALRRYAEFCDLHYNRKRKYGDPRWQPRKGRPLTERFWEKVSKSADQDGCWLWTGATNIRGYGFIGTGTDRQTQKAHRVAYELTYGQVPEGTELDHLCRATLCVRPDHLEPVTHRVNVLRGTGPTAENAQKDACSHGHPFDAANTIRRSDGGRRCRECKRRQGRERYARMKEVGASDSLASGASWP